MSSSSTRRWPRLAHLVFLAGCASATITLTAFEDISDKVTRKSCISAYGAPLINCQLEDFTNNNACSSKCISSIKEAQSAIQESCDNISVDSGSLLSRGQGGQLVNSLCITSGREGDSNDKTETKESTTKAKATGISTSVIHRETTTTAKEQTTTSEAAQITSLVLAGGSGGDSDLPTGAIESILPSSSTASAAQASETANSNGRGGDPFATPQNSASSALSLGITSFVMSAMVCIAVIM